jgi:tetratricopeptide (TPR) repeat protein
LRADALLRLQRFDEAGAAYEAARTAAARAGIDSLARQAEAAIPVCYFRHAEAAVAQDSTAYEQHAVRFERVASGWPAYEHAHRAQYRAGRAWIAAGSRARGIRSLEVVIRDFPGSEYVRDARLEIAHAWEREGEVIRAAEAWAAFAFHHPEDTDAGEAQLKAADLFDTAGLAGRADSTRLAYVDQHPDDHATALEIFEQLARRELDRLGADQPISTLMPDPKRTSRAAGRRERGATAAAPVGSPLAEYLRRAAAHPEWASRDLIAEVRFRQGEEARTIYEAARLTQPLERSIPTRQRGLDSLVAAYNRSAELGVPEWSQASAFRIGEALVAFGVALETSERPADLTGDDLVAYEDVLYGQADAFHVRGEQVWTDLLRAERDRASAGEWVSRARTALWQRLAQRFFFMPEAEYPLTAADPAERKRSPQ